MAKFLKENWFVAIVAVFFIGVAIFFTYDQNKDKLPGKSVGGKQVVFSVDDTNYTADDLYDRLSSDYYESRVFLSFQKALLDEATKNDKDIETNVKTQYQQTLQYYQSQYGYDEEYLNQIARYYYGYDTFYDYMLYSNKSMSVFKDYIKTNIADLLTDEKKAELNPRIVSYVVIAMDDPANPTAEESSKLKAVQDAWASDTYTAENFGDFAAAYSQDGNAANKGVFGYIDTKTTGIDETFLNTALSLKDGEVSEWVYSEQFGYFLIKCDTSDTAALLEEDDFVSEVLNMNEGLQNKVMWQKAEELGVSYGDEEVEKIIKDHMNVNESEGN